MRLKGDCMKTDFIGAEWSFEMVFGVEPIAD